MDIAHPITQECRVYIQDSILTAYKEENDKQVKEGNSYSPASDMDLDQAGDHLAPGEKKEETVAEIEEAKDIEL